MKLLAIRDDGKMILLGENELFDLWLYFYDMFVSNVVEVIDESDE